MKKHLEAIIPYLPGKSSAHADAIKLSSNENLAGCSPHVQKALQAAVAHSAYYPNQTHALVAAIAKHVGVSEDHVMVGNGSDELITLLAMGYLEPQHTVLSAEQTFSQYQFAAQLIGARYAVSSMVGDSYDLDAMADQITDSTRLVFIANPNNPTGTMVTESAVIRFLNRVPSSCLVVLDEAYYEYVERSDYPNGVAMLSQFSNLVITRTFSKAYGLAGLRLGYAIASPDIIRVLNVVKQPFHVNALAMSAGLAALGDPAFIRESVATVSEQRQRTMAFLDGFKDRGVSYTDSVANFVLIDLPMTGQAAFDYLYQRGIVVRDLASFGRPQAIRVTVGLPKHMDRFFSAFSELMHSGYVW
jgi:histidinol-phosphate aminotransferase